MTMNKRSIISGMSVVVVAVLAMLPLLSSCRKKAPDAVDSRMELKEKALAQPETPRETEMKCISIERAIDIAEMVEIEAGRVSGMHSADKVDAMMRKLGYARSNCTEVYQQGRAIIYTQGCDVDDMGSMKDVTESRATLVTVAGEGQPGTAPLVVISMTDEEVYRQLKHEMAELGFMGKAPEFTNGTGYKILADSFLSGTGYIIQISREL